MHPMIRFFALLRRLGAALFYTWVSPLVRLGRQRALNHDDMPPLPARLNPRDVRPGFRQLPLDRPWALLGRVVWIMRADLLRMLALLGFTGLCNVSAPLLVHHLLEMLAAGGRDVALVPALLTASCLCLASVGDALSFQHYIYWAVDSSQRVASSMNDLLYRHSLALSRKTRLKFPVGDIVNYMGSDSDAVGDFTKTLAEVTYSACLVVAVLSFLFHFLGLAALAAVTVLLLLSPITGLIARGFIRIDARSMARRDERVSKIAQALAGIRIVKFFAWQDRILEEIRAVRDGEVKERRRLAFLRSASVIFDLGPSTLVSVATFGTYIALGHSLDAATVFATLGLLSQLEYPFGNLTNFISGIAEARVSAARIGTYLREETLPLEARPVSAPFRAIGFEARGLAVRYAGAETDAMQAVDLRVKPGEAVAVVGPVGAGKSTLLLALLDEVPRRQGSLSFQNIPESEAPRTAYVPQEAFVLNGSLKENILFGLPDADLEEALESCALSFDVGRLPGGLLTEIGEHGVNLSGGQKQRLCLARALLARPGLALLDDPLSAVDGHTEDHLVNDYLFGTMAASTRVVVTHRLKHLARFDRVLFLEDGKVVGLASYRELLAASPRFQAFVAETLREESLHAVQAEPQAAASTEVVRITDDEDREKGAVSSQVYLAYLRTMGGHSPLMQGLMVAALLGAVLCVTTMPIVQISWLSVWTDSLLTHAAAAPSRGAPLSPWLRPLLGTETHNIYLYGAFGGCLLLAVFSQNLLWSLRAVAAGRRLHDEALKATLAAPLRFFDATPIGRVLNRFSRDVDGVERQLPWAFEGTVRAVFATLGSIGVLLSVLPAIILVILPVLAIFFRMQATYRASAREAQRLASIASSPRFAHFKETLQGLTVIRGFHQTEAFTAKFHRAVGEYQRMFHAMVIINRWFSVRVPLISSCVSLAVAMGIVFCTRLGLVAAGTTGMVLNYALRFWGHLNWSVRAFSEVESRMTSVERLRYYASLSPEADVTLAPALAADAVWPTAGQLEFRGVTARYAPHLPDVLRDLSFTVPAGARVGLIGRTGSGKSTVFQVLFRFLAVRSGAVLVDGVNIARIPLARLRRSLAVIPQDPTLFQGRLRDNLDRFQQNSDEAIWNALGRAHLKTYVEGLPGGLEAEVKENGLNFSQGQRQLFCLARALLVDARIIVIDEATASVDVETDTLIQATLRRECAGRTLLIIAHRLWTVHDCDRVFELEDGRLKRSFVPSALGDSVPDARQEQNRARKQLVVSELLPMDLSSGGE